MFSPEEQQVEICLLKSNLEEIENDLVEQRLALPALDVENEQKYRETMAALKVVRSLNTEVERLTLENVQLTAKRMQLKQQCDEISKNLETARVNRDKLADALKQEEQESELYIRRYEDSLQEIAKRFRKTRRYYNEEEINTELNNVNNLIAELKDRMREKQSDVYELRAEVDATQPQVPDTLLEMIGKLQLDEKIKCLTEKYENLIEKRNSVKE